MSECHFDSSESSGTLDVAIEIGTNLTIAVACGNSLCILSSFTKKRHRTKLQCAWSLQVNLYPTCEGTKDIQEVQEASLSACKGLLTPSGSC